MSQDFLCPQRDQPLLLPVDMREWLPEDDLVFVVLDAVDNGTPGRSSTPDMIRFSFSQIVLVSPDCYLPLLPPVAVQRGNVAVHDASP